jgi:hypothetical protein
MYDCFRRNKVTVVPLVFRAASDDLQPRGFKSRTARVQLSQSARIQVSQPGGYNVADGVDPTIAKRAIQVSNRVDTVSQTAWIQVSNRVDPMSRTAPIQVSQSETEERSPALQRWVGITDSEQCLRHGRQLEDPGFENRETWGTRMVLLAASR